MMTPNTALTIPRPRATAPMMSIRRLSLVFRSDFIFRLLKIAARMRQVIAVICNREEAKILCFTEYGRHVLITTSTTTLRCQHRTQAYKIKTPTEFLKLPPGKQKNTRLS